MVAGQMPVLAAASCWLCFYRLLAVCALHVAPYPKNQSSVYVYWLCIIDTTPRAHSLPLASPSASGYVRCCCAVCAALAAASGRRRRRCARLRRAAIIWRSFDVHIGTGVANVSMHWRIWFVEDEGGADAAKGGRAYTNTAQAL